MGLHFHYKGRLREASKLPDLVYELEDICQTLSWSVQLFETNFPNDQFLEDAGKKPYGLLFTPADCDPVLFKFDATGRMWNPFLLEMLEKGKDAEVKIITVQLNLDDDNPEPVISEQSKDFDLDLIVYQISVKTTIEEPSAYIQLLELIRYISSKYLDDFSLTDDAGYWATGNTEKLSKRMFTSKLLLDELHEKISEQSFKNPEEFLDFIKKISAMLKKNLKDESE